MKTISAQIKNKTLIPYSHEDRQELAEFHDNQLVRVSIKGTRKQRSLDQLKMFWACCRTVADNTEDENWNTPEKVAEQVKLKLQFIKSYTVFENKVHIITRSISFPELKHLDACQFFERSWPVMAKKIGITEDELLQNAGNNQP